MLDKEHERLLDLILDYHRALHNWRENTIRDNAITLRKTLKALMKESKQMYDEVSNIQWEIRQKNIAEWQEKGYIPKGRKPRRKTTKDLSNE